VHLRSRIPSLCAGSVAIFLAANGQLPEALSVLAIGLLAELASALALVAQGAGEGLRAGLRQRLHHRASSPRGDEPDRG
jgi:hypothetical protein